MAKRGNTLSPNAKSKRSPKTKKRIAAKKVMLANKSKGKKRKGISRLVK